MPIEENVSRDEGRRRTSVCNKRIPGGLEAQGKNRRIPSLKTNVARKPPTTTAKTLEEGAYRRGRNTLGINLEADNVYCEKRLGTRKRGLSRELMIRAEPN